MTVVALFIAFGLPLSFVALGVGEYRAARTADDTARAALIAFFGIGLTVAIVLLVLFYPAPEHVPCTGGWGAYCG